MYNKYSRLTEIHRQQPPPELTRTMKPLVAVQRIMDATVLEENSPRTPTIPGHHLEDLFWVVTVLAAPVVVAVLLVMMMLVAEAEAAGAPHTGLEEEPVAEAIAEAEAMQTATSPVPHVAAMMPAAELKKYDATSPPRQATTSASSPSPPDSAIYSSRRNSNLWDHQVRREARPSPMAQMRRPLHRKRWWQQ
jgi:hypothetical protein